MRRARRRAASRAQAGARPADAGTGAVSGIVPTLRGVAQPGSASALGAEGREFESRRPDQTNQGLTEIAL